MSEKDVPKPPYVPADEAAVIGAILIDPSTYGDVAFLTDKMFGTPLYRMAWKAVCELVREGVTPDVVTVTDRVEALDEHAAQESYLLLQAVNDTPDYHNARHYAKSVLRAYQQRAIIRTAEQLVQAAHGRVDPAQIAQKGLSQLSRILAWNPDERTGRITYAQAIHRANEDTFERQVDRLQYPDDPRLTFLSGFGGLDRATGGFEPGDLIILASRIGGGKSGFGLSLARRIGARCHRTGIGTVDYLTMETSVLALARRSLGHYSHTDTLDMRLGFVKRALRDEEEVDVVDRESYMRFLDTAEDEAKLVGDALGFLEQVMTTDQLAVYVAEAKTNRDLRVLIVDQLNLFADRNDIERIRMSNMSRALKQLAVRFGIVIICMVQLNRETEKWADKRPSLTNIKESDGIGADADMVLALHRPSYYFPTPIRLGSAFEKWAELIILKYRNGKDDISIPLEFNRGFFTDWDAEAWPVAEMRRLVAQVEKGDAV